MTHITDQFIADTTLAVGDTIKFTEQVHGDEFGGYVGIRVVVGKVLELETSADSRCLLLSVRVSVVESWGAMELDVGAEIRRSPKAVQCKTVARLLWDDESQRAELT
jgi:hypothetical protein